MVHSLTRSSLFGLVLVAHRTSSLLAPIHRYQATTHPCQTPFGSRVSSCRSTSPRSQIAFFTSTTRSSSTSSPTTTSRYMKRVLVPIADGSEEIETTCITDTLTRFGAQVTVASVMPGLVCTMSRGIKIMADVSIENAVEEEWDLVVLPGGMPGAEHLRDSKPLITLLKTQRDAQKLYAAVCASPAVVLVPHGLATATGLTCYPAPIFRNALMDPVDDNVVIKDNLIVSKGPGTSLLFALTLGEQLFGKQAADEVAAAMLVDR